MLYNGEVRQTMGKPVRGGQGLSNNLDVQGWPKEPGNGGSAGIPSLEPLRWGYPHGNVCDPELLEIWGGISGSLAAFLLSPTQQQGAGRAGGAQPQPARDLPQLFPSPKENRGCLKRWARPRREGRKEPFSKTLLPGKRRGGEGGGGRARIPALS